MAYKKPVSVEVHNPKMKNMTTFFLAPNTQWKDGEEHTITDKITLVSPNVRSTSEPTECFHLS